MMYVAVSYVIETITKTWLGEFLRARIWAPLFMHSTFFSLPDAQKSEASGGATLARGYYWNNQTKEFIPQAFLDAPENSGAGSVISNVLDYAKYLRALIDMDTRILTKDSYHTLRQGKFLTPSPAGPFTLFGMYGLGWR
jgi:CubicO group peptidase (beta-lactamase class C family)